MNSIIYNPDIFNIKITGSTNKYANSSANIDPNININKTAKFNIFYFDKNKITKADIVYNLVNYIEDYSNKFNLKVIIADENREYDIILTTGIYCIKIYYEHIFDYFLLEVINDSDNYNSIIYNKNCCESNIIF